MESLGPLLQAKPSTSKTITDMELSNNISQNLPSLNVAASGNSLNYVSELQRYNSNTACIKCQEIYHMLNQHISECHGNDSGNGKDSSDSYSILKNILSSILTLLTTSNKATPEAEPREDPFAANSEAALPKSTSGLASIVTSSSNTSQKPPQQTNELPQLSSLVSQESITSQGHLEKLLKAAQANRKASVEQNAVEHDQRKTVLQGISLLDGGVQVPGNIPLVLANQLQLDGSSRPVMLATNPSAKTSEKSDLDVADILVNKMPIPSVNKEESSQAQLYLKQLAEGLATGRPDILRHTETVNDAILNDRDLLNALLNFNNSTGCSIAAAPQGDSSQKPVVETITQIIAAQKQLTSLLSLLGRRQNDVPAMPVALTSQLIETPLNNPLFTSQRQKVATPGMLQIPLSILPALAPTSQGFIPGNLIQPSVAANEGNNTIPLSNLFTRTTQAFPISSAGGTITLPALALPTGMFQNSVPILQQTVQGALRGTTQPTVLMSSVIPTTMTSSIPASLFPTQTGHPSFIIPGKTITGSSSQSSAEPKTLFTFPQTTVPSLTEQLFQNTSTIPKFALTNKPSVFNLGNIPGISVLNAGLQGQAHSQLPGPSNVRPIPVAPSKSVIVSSGSPQTSSVDKIQGLIHAAIQAPNKGNTVESPSMASANDPHQVFMAKRKATPVSGLSKTVKMDPAVDSEKSDPAKLYKCRSCNTTFSVLSTLQQHEQTHLGTKMQCNYCNDVFSDAAVFQKHISLHRGQENVHHCEYCSKLFTSRGELQKHLAEHTQKRPYKCTHCSKTFRDPGSLQKHVRIHTGERPYKCGQCPKAFAEYSSLRKHDRVHTGEKPYKCRHCPKAFSISGNLQRHLFIHTGERPYRCTKCPKAFNNPSHLRRHVKNLHEVKKELSASSNSRLDSDSDSEAPYIDAD